MIIITEKTVAGGDCIGRIDGKTVFVPFALPGETVEIEITESRKDYSRARLVSVVEPSIHRVAPPCPLFGKCGGCSLQMADSAYQSELRAGILTDSLRRSRVSHSAPVGIESANPWEYRCRAQFHRAPNGSPGFSAARSSSIIPVKDCPILVPELRAALENGSIAQAIREAEKQTRATLARRTDLRLNVFASAGRLYHQSGETLARANVAGKDIHFDARGFFQSNLSMLSRLVEVVSRDLPKAGTLLDFYAGVGTFSAFTAGNFDRAVLVEHNAAALAFARQNVFPAGGPEALDLHAVSDADWPIHPASREPFQVAIVDPPRQGIARPALDWFISSGVPEIRYVSCDPVTFARDAAFLVSGGFTLDSVTLFDFYPQTHHAEVYGRFRR